MIFQLKKMNNQEKGLLYEKFIKSIIINNLGKNAYLWNECPENILIDNNLIHSHNDMRLLRKYFKEGQIHNHKDIVEVELNYFDLL